MIIINKEHELSKYNLDKKWNDFIAMQKEVITTLKREGYFCEADVVNRDTKMVVKITTKGIKETLGAGKRFQSLPKKLKENKIAVLCHLKQIIEEAELILDDVENLHDKNGYMFAYFGCNVLIDEEEYYVRVSVKKKIASNIFWIHNIDERKSSELLDPSKGQN